MSGTTFAIGIEGVDTTQAYSVSANTPEFPGLPFAVGTRIHATNNGVWVFCVAGGAINQNDVAVISTPSTFTAVALSNAVAKGFLGRQAGRAGATVTTGQGFWLQVNGFASAINAATGSAANTVLSSTSTAGRLGAGVGGSSAKVTGLTLVATAASNTAAAVLLNPAIGTDD